MFCTVALLSPPYNELTYALPAYIPSNCLVKGQRVAVPLGNGQLRVAIVLDLCASHNLGEKVAIKELAWVLEKQPLLSDEILLLVEELSSRQGQSKAQIFASILPQELRTAASLRLCEYKENQRPYRHSFKELKTYSKEKCAELFNAYYYNNNVEVQIHEKEKAAYEVCRLLKDPPWAIRPTAQKQRELLEYLYNNGDSSRKILQNILGNGTLQVITKLTELGLIGIFPQEDVDIEEEENQRILALLESTLYNSKPIYDFSAEQAQAIQEGSKVIEAKNNACVEVRLVHGITGSGKTALYMELARKSLIAGRSVFLLAPEVALALKLKKDVENLLLSQANIPVYFSHGYQSARQRAKIYKAIASEENPCIIIGTRSALFHSLHAKQNIGLIVLDEEHDTSYKQDEKFFYHAKEIALFRAKQHNSLMILGSATPDIKSFYSAKQNFMALDTLSTRVGGGALPEIELVDMAENKADELLTQKSLEALKTCLENDEQAVILLNRRGYSPIVYCLDCKTVQRCPNCSIALTYHKKREALTCHYCNYSRPFPSACTQCKGMHYLPLGDGTEKLEEQLNSFINTLPHEIGEKKILRLDRDSTRRQGSMEDILARFAKKEASILVGTQMLSKGHHFPDVSLAIIADADLTLNFPDYRAAERTFQLLVQSAGRAGRAVNHGKVLIQTRDTKHYCWQYVQNHDYYNFYAHELELREKRHYPPFTKLALIRLNFPFQMKNFYEAYDLIKKHIRLASSQINQKVKVLGPVESPLAKIQNVKRYQCLLKAEDWKDIRYIFYCLQDLQKKEPSLRDVRISLDLDPVNLL